MSVLTQLLLSIAMIAVGAVKIVTHLGQGAILNIQMCSGRTVALPLDSGISFLERTHCWGCYMALAGLVIFGFSAFRVWRQRASLATH